MNNMVLGIELMVYGLTGVFSVLIVFYILIMVIVKVFPVKEDEK